MENDKKYIVRHYLRSDDGERVAITTEPLPMKEARVIYDKLRKREGYATILLRRE